MSIKITDIDFAAAKSALARIDRLMGDFGYVAPENHAKTQDLLNQIAAGLNEFATAMLIIKPRSQQS